LSERLIKQGISRVAYEIISENRSRTIFKGYYIW